jgi:two-component system sensor histidine kinase RpfC
MMSAVRRRLKGRPDSEHEMTINRIVLSTVVLAYLVIAQSKGHDAAQDVFHDALVLFGIYYAASLVLFVHILAKPGVSHGRRILAISLDIGMLTYGMHMGESAFAIGYPLYLWIIFGNGFRFGVKYLLGAAISAIIAFALLILTTPPWHNNLEMSFGLMAGLFLLPAYVSALIRKLSEAKQQAEEASKAKSLFLASVSHELRTPLNAIITLSDLLRGSAIPREQREMSETIGMSGRSLLKLINSILDLSRMEANADRMQTAPLSVLETVLGVRRVLAVSAEAKGLYLSVEIGAGMPSSIIGNRQKLEEILTNLIGNATKFTSSGGIRVLVDVAEIGPDNATLRFSVHDTGIGIHKSAQASIFEQFTQADHTIMDRFGGTGLGLAIVKQLVERQGGQVGVISVPGMGSEFWFTLPVALAPAPDETPAAARHPVVLLSHDFALYTRLSSSGRQVLRVTDGAAALAELRATMESGCRGLLLIDADTMPESVCTGLMAMDRDFGALRRSVIGLMRGPDSRIEEAPMPLLVHLSRPVKPAELTQLAMLAAGGGEIVGKGPAGDAELAADPRQAIPDLRILVAEDNTTNQIVIRKLLERDGHSVTIVSNGEDAVEALVKQSFDIVLMDINMPVMNGLEATKLARFAMLGGIRIPIYALTADVTEDTRKRCLDAGMEGCLHKPIEQGELADALRMSTRRNSAPPQAADRGPVADGAPALGAVPMIGPGTAAPGPLIVDLEAIPVVDEVALSNLLQLGDLGFMGELIEEFLSSSTQTLNRMEAAAERLDAAAFQDILHALRSSAANIGARRLFTLALEWRQCSQDDLARSGDQRLALLRDSFAEADAALRAWLRGQRHLRMVS